MLSVKLKLTEFDDHLDPDKRPSILLSPVAVTLVDGVATPKASTDCGGLATPGNTVGKSASDEPVCFTAEIVVDMVEQAPFIKLGKIHDEKLESDCRTHRSIKLLCPCQIMNT
jgi:hypothetical protein